MATESVTEESVLDKLRIQDAIALELLLMDIDKSETARYILSWREGKPKLSEVENDAYVLNTERWVNGVRAGDVLLTDEQMRRLSEYVQRAMQRRRIESCPMDTEKDSYDYSTLNWTANEHPPADEVNAECVRAAGLDELDRRLRHAKAICGLLASDPDSLKTEALNSAWAAEDILQGALEWCEAVRHAGLDTWEQHRGRAREFMAAEIEKQEGQA